MVLWWESLDALSRVLYYVTIPASLVLVIQMLLMVIGLGGDDGMDVNPSDTSGIEFDLDSDFDVDFDADFSADAVSDADISDLKQGSSSSLRMFTLQGVLAFLAVSGWTSILLYHAGLNPFLAIAQGFIAGVLAMYGIAKLFMITSKFASNGNISLKNALGATAQVYLPITPGGQGKVTLVVQERFIEADAISESDDVLTTGNIVRVVDVRAGLLVVESE